MKEVLPGYWMVETPENVHQYVLQCIPEAGLTWLYFLDESGKEVARQEQLFGQWEIVGVVAEIKEEVARGIMPAVDFKTASGKILYYGYGNAPCRDFRDIVEAAFDTATESLLSLARSHGFEPDQSILLKLTNK